MRVAVLLILLHREELPDANASEHHCQKPVYATSSLCSALLCPSVAALLYAGITVVLLMTGIFIQFKFAIEDIKHVAITSIELIDLFLISTVLYIVSLGLYSLFIDNKLPLPHWLEITNFNDLERRLLSVIVVLLAVTFLGIVVDGISVIIVLWRRAFLLGLYFSRWGICFQREG